MKRITYFLSHPIQYFAPLLRDLAKKADLTVYYFSDAGITEKNDIGFGQKIKWDTPLLEGYRSFFLKNYSKKPSLNNKFTDVFNPGVIKAIIREKSSVIIVNGWKYSSTLLAIFFGRLSGRQVWLRAENPLNQEVKKNGIKLTIKKILLKHLLFRIFVSKCLYIGTESKLFFEFYGVPESRLVYTPYAVDNDFFAGQYRQLQNDLPAVRQQLGLLADKKIILFSGKYIEKKRPLDLIGAFHLLDNNKYMLVMVGEGALRVNMEKFIAEHGIEGVILTGFINQSQIPKYYAVADVFVMCSGAGETWGLSVNEAMNFEKPVVVSKTCGCCGDLVRHGENGFAFEEGNIKELAEYLEMVLEDDEFRASAGRKSREIVDQFSIGHITDNIVAALN